LDIQYVENVLKSDLKLTEEEVKLFILLVYNGRINITTIAKMLSWSITQADKTAKLLVEKGMIIDITKTDYQSLHPRFAIVNRYRKRCLEENIIFRRNVSIDNIAIFLEGPYDDPKTK
jgi:sugar-specific transcriptional regulator TrmB